MSCALVWFRYDLRLHDHTPLRAALHACDRVLLVYCFDPRQFGTTAFGFPKTAAFRAQFLLESVADLRQQARSRGGELLVCRGWPEVELPALIQRVGATHLYFHGEVTAEEVAVERALYAALTDWKGSIHAFWGHTLYHPDDLPFAIADLPEVFTQFRKQVEKYSAIRPPLEAPNRLPPLRPDGGLDIGAIPALADLGLALPPRDDRAVLEFAGGGTAGQARLHAYFWERDRLRTYKETRNGMLEADDSTKISPWLAHGCLSPRWIAAEVARYEAERVANDSTYWLVFELLWRDYFRFVAAKHGDRLFYRSGLRRLALPWQQDWERFALWQSGHTGFPLVDANMRELAATGFMSNRGRQNVASFLTKNLGIDWRMGAEWFESLLIDYDVTSNWGNWNYTAGVGNDARGFRFFNILKQSQAYDPDGAYVKHWLPELRSLPASKVHQPWKLLPVEQQRFGVRLGADYPHPVVDLFASAKANERLYAAAVARDRPSA